LRTGVASRPAPSPSTDFRASLAPQQERTILKSRNPSASMPGLCLLLAILCILLSPAGAPAAQKDGTQGEDFGPEAKLLYRVVACSGDAALPAHLDPRIIAQHCQSLKARMARYRRVYLARAKPYLAALRPSGLP